MPEVTQGYIVCEHRQHLELSVWEYSVLLGVHPEEVDRVERGESTISAKMASSLKRWKLKSDAVRKLPAGRGYLQGNRCSVDRTQRRRFDRWQDVPIEDHAEAWRHIEHGSEKTLAEVGDLMGLSRERIRQIEVKCVQKMRLGFESEGVDADAAFAKMRESTLGPLDRHCDAVGGTEGDDIIETTWRSG